MSIYAFRRMREQNEAAQKAASVSTSKPKPKRKSQKVSVNGDLNSSDSR